MHRRLFAAATRDIPLELDEIVESLSVRRLAAVPAVALGAETRIGIARSVTARSPKYWHHNPSGYQWFHLAVDPADDDKGGSGAVNPAAARVEGARPRPLDECVERVWVVLRPVGGMGASCHVQVAMACGTEADVERTHYGGAPQWGERKLRLKGAEDYDDDDDDDGTEEDEEDEEDGEEVLTDTDDDDDTDEDFPKPGGGNDEPVDQLAMRIREQVAVPKGVVVLDDPVDDEPLLASRPKKAESGAAAGAAASATSAAAAGGEGEGDDDSALPPQRAHFRQVTVRAGQRLIWRGVEIQCSLPPVQGFSGPTERSVIVRFSRSERLVKAARS